jgi:hypothetical protein
MTALTDCQTCGQRSHERLVIRQAVHPPREPRMTLVRFATLLMVGLLIWLAGWVALSVFA